MQILTQQPTRRRVSRSPNFPAAGIMKPYGLYPVFGMPVLPGETVQSMSLKWSVVGSPVLNPMAGAWLEMWAVYFKLTDLDPDLGQMFISDSYTDSGFDAGSDSARYFHKTGQKAWVQKCTELFHKKFFIHEDETARTIDGVPQVRLNNVGWYQNFTFEPTDETVPITDASDTYAHLQQWSMLQQMNMTEMTYDKYLETFGVNPKNVSQGDPEILRYARSWTKPSNTINPADGAPSSAWVWNDEMKMDKAKRFVEPGFVIVFATCRPKMFQKGLVSSVMGEMWGFSDWYPSYNLQDPTAGVKTVSTDSALFDAATRTDVGEKDILYDHRDILSHGEQFINCASADHIFRLPTANGLIMNDASGTQDLRGAYCTSSDVDDLFVSATAGDKFLSYEGIGRAVISGHVTDSTPG